MPLILILLALFAPRLVIVAIWLFSNWLDAAVGNLLLILLGFIFLPTSLLWYAAVIHWFGGVWSLIPAIGLVTTLLIDLSPTFSFRRREYATA